MNICSILCDIVYWCCVKSMRLYLFIFCLLYQQAVKSVKAGKLLDSIEEFNSWDAKRSCDKVDALFKIQSNLKKKLRHLANNEVNHFLSPQVKIMELFLKELNDTKYAIFSSFNFLTKLLKQDYKYVGDVKKSVAARIIYFENEVGREQGLFNDILKAEKELNNILKESGKTNDTLSKHHSKMRQYIEEVLDDVSVAADKLENKLEENIYADKSAGGSYEVVLRLNKNEQGDILDSHTKNASDLLNNNNKYFTTLLIDASSNQFVLSKPNDPTLPNEDRHLLQSIITIIVSSFMFAVLCNLLHLPTMFGFILSGMVMGPPGFNVVQSVVQVETLGEFGVFFILFTLGLEFSPERIKKVWKVAVYGSLTMMIGPVALSVILGFLLNIPPRASSFVAVCLSLSSTPLVAKFVSSSEKTLPNDETTKIHKNGDDFSNPLLGILVLQDVYLGFFMAILPALAGHHGTRSTRIIKSGLIHDLFHGIRHSEESVAVGWLVFELLSALNFVVILAYVVSKYVLEKFLRFLQSREDGHLELMSLGIVTICILFLQLTETLGISMELGCFIAGTIVSLHGEVVVKKFSTLLETLKDFFSCLFFASIGLHIFPTFLYDQFSLLLALTLGVVLIKFAVASLILRWFLPNSRNVRFIVSAGLAQVSEFSFVLGSRARRLGLISREIYLIIVSVTSLSLFIAPLLWKVALWKYAGRRLQGPLFLARITTFIFNKIANMLALI